MELVSWKTLVVIVIVVAVIAVVGIAKNVYGEQTGGGKGYKEKLLEYREAKKVYDTCKKAVVKESRERSGTFREIKDWVKTTAKERCGPKPEPPQPPKKNRRRR